jgi:predicted transposase YbfD/YdcC
VPLGSAGSRNKGRNRDERRSVTIFEPASALLDTDWRHHLAAIIRVEREVFTRNSSTGLLHRSTETAFYVANTPITAARAAQAIRAHWAIETTSHYCRDVTMGEDRSRIRSNPRIFARVRSFAFNILIANRGDTLRQDRYRAALGGLQPLLKLLDIRQR